MDATNLGLIQHGASFFKYVLKFYRTNTSKFFYVVMHVKKFKWRTTGCLIQLGKIDINFLILNEMIPFWTS